MVHMLKYMKKYVWALVAIVLLLGIQAICDLTLPTYTAAIVDVGIQQQGVEHSAPTVVRQSTLDQLRLWMTTEEETTLINPAYAALTADEARQQGVTVAQEPILGQIKTDKETQERLDAVFARAFGLQNLMSGESMLPSDMLNGLYGLPQGDAQPMTAEEIGQKLAQLPPEQMDAIIAKVEETLLSVLPESTLEQSANSAVRAEYAALGVDLNGLQSASIWRNGGIMLLIALLGAAAAVAVGYFGSVTAARLGCDLRGRVFRKVVNFSQTEMDRFSTASLITRSTNDIQQVQMVMVFLLRTVIYAPIIGIGGVLRAVQTNASMAWVIFLGVVMVMSIVLVLTSVAMPRFKRMQSLIDKVNQVMRETLTGLPVIRAFCTQKREEERFDDASTKLKKTQLFVNRIMSGMMPLMMLVMNGIAILIMWTGSQGINQGAMQVGDMMAYIQYTMQIIMAFLMIAMMSVMLPRASVSAKRIHEILDTELSITDPKQPKALDGAKRGQVEFRDVSFRYPGAEDDMLSHISFTAMPGQTTAILGGTGSGKSTLINLIPRFYDVTGGQVLVDGVDVREISLKELRDHIGYVPQKGVLFSGTIEENLTFGSDGIPQERVEQAARIAQAEDFIAEREQGYDSEIAQGGANVSGGQKQRLSIARAIAKDPEVYIFDDSFSALDFKTDAAVRAALASATRDATQLIVAQRISTVMHAEQILVLDDGKLAGKGTHAELMRDCEVYRQIATSQLSKEELNRGIEA